MTLQQLRYLVAIAELGSMNAAAGSLYASQSNLSTAIKDLEKELGIRIFTRSNRGVVLTNEGTELVGYARQVIEQADLLESRYAQGTTQHLRLAVSTQHYAFAVESFVETVDRCEDEDYEFILRECATGEILNDLKTFRSEIGILYTDSYNRRVMRQAFDDVGLAFTPLISSKVHVFVGENHPLAEHRIVEPAELEAWPRYSFEQGTSGSLYFSEEPLSYLPHRRNIRISDRGTLSNLLTGHDGYTLSTGMLSSEMHTGIVSIPLDTDEVMQVGYLMHRERKPSKMLLHYIERLKANATAQNDRQAERDAG